MKLAVCLPVVAVLVAASFRTATTYAHPIGPPPAVTGVAGEDTCVMCHNSFELNAGRDERLGDLKVTGFPARYEPGKSYAVTVELTHLQDRSAWGFQLSTRAGGKQAGHLKPIDSHTQLVTQDGLEYVEHTMEGIDSNVFEFTWVAPESTAGEVLVGVAGNAADGDTSEHGDFVYATSLTIPPGPPAQ
jgi:hypothetical protein